MGKRSEPAWWASARALHASGASLMSIAKEFGVGTRAVNFAVSEKQRKRAAEYGLRWHNEKYQSDPAYRAKCMANIQRGRARRRAQKEQAP